jgi:aminoglycoside phosphotransferase family enzyme/predicted kinase
MEELRLNRRLAADSYLDVVAITGSDEAPRINGLGEVIEYAVKMRQFPSDATLGCLAAHGCLNQLHIDALAARLAHFHLAECDRAAVDSVWGEPDSIARQVEENFRILSEKQGDTTQATSMSALHDWCVAEHTRLAPLMLERKKNGFVRECHGDLHLANLAWVDGQLVIFDSLEFSPDLRWIDVISEVAFCYMDLLHRNLPGFASRFLNAWLEATGDYQGMALLRYYAIYRAMVRAKVAALRIEQGDEPSAVELTDCLQLAEHLLRVPPLKLWITHGLSGSGKTTLTQTLLEKHGMIRLRSDVERKRLTGLDVISCGAVEVGTGRYSRQASVLTYDYLAVLAQGLLQTGWSVVVDAAFLERIQRDQFRNLAARLGVQFHILDLQASPDTLRERVRQRQADGKDASEANLYVLEHQLKNARPLDADELTLV